MVVRRSTHEIEKRRHSACQLGSSLPYAQPNCSDRKLRVIAFIVPKDRTGLRNGDKKEGG